MALLAGAGALAAAGCAAPTGSARAAAATPAPNAASGPIGQLSLHLVGVHTIKSDPGRQFVAHHYCHALNSQLIQCAIFDSDAATARLIGIEYIIPGDVYRLLSPQEQQSWHPHTYEVTGHLLRAPELPADQEQALLAQIRTTYGRTFHEWDPKVTPGHPLGAPELAWAITGPGQIQPAIQQEFDRSLHG
jgi:hypothetical protein